MCIRDRFDSVWICGCYRLPYKKIYTQTERQTDRETQTHRHTDRHTHTHTHTHTHFSKNDFFHLVSVVQSESATQTWFFFPSPYFHFLKEHGSQNIGMENHTESAPVSYTHLDVYKRQEHGSNNFCFKTYCKMPALLNTLVLVSLVGLHKLYLPQ